jgi:hypothetical protein
MGVAHIGPVINTNAINNVPISEAASPILSHLLSRLVKYIKPDIITMKYERKPTQAEGTCT